MNVMEEAIQSKKKKPELVERGISLFKARKYKEALEIFKEVYRTNPKDPEYNYYIGLTYLNLGNYDAALNHLLHSAKDNTSYFVALRSNMLCGYIYTMKKEYKLAENCFREVLKINPQSVSALLAIAHVFEKTGRYDQSLIYLKKAMDIDPENPRVLNALAYIYAEIGINLGEATRLARKAISLDPDSPEIRDTLAWVYYKKGEIIQAYNEIKQAISLMPDNEEIKQHYKEITSKLQG